MEKKVRVRFAPSPTGPLHIGGLRTALFNYLFAKKHNGVFILRIEDTDQARYVSGAEEYITESLKWCGLTVDEGINEGGKYGPYRQSERKDIYKKEVLKLIKNGNAYYAFDTSEELNDMRKELEKNNSSVRQYNAATRGNMKNSFTLSKEELKKKLESGEPHVIRFNIPENQELTVNDIIRGKVTVNTSQLDDKVLFKSDGMPTYHLANIVDDLSMKISHVIRGEEWLPSLPLHVLLYKSFGKESEMPQFAHLPLLLKPNGKGKLSKRDGDKMGFPVFPIEWKDPKTKETAAGYREDGYLVEAFINLLALLGWSPGTHQEFFTIDELIEQFDLKRVGKAGAKFSHEKAKWFNQHYLKEKSDKELAELFLPILKQKGIDAKKDYVEKVVALVKERLVFTNDFWNQSAFFFETPETYNPKVVKKRWKSDTPKEILKIKEILDKIPNDNFNTASTENAVKEHIITNKLNFGKILNPLRLVITGTGGGPHLFDIISMIGKDETIKRINKGVLVFSS